MADLIRLVVEEEYGFRYWTAELTSEELAAFDAALFQWTSTAEPHDWADEKLIRSFCPKLKEVDIDTVGLRDGQECVVYVIDEAESSGRLLERSVRFM